MNWLLLSFIVLLFPRNGNSNVLDREITRKAPALNGAREYPSLLLSDVSNKQLYGGRQSLFGVLQGQVLTTSNAIPKPTTVNNIKTLPIKSNTYSFTSPREFPSILLSDVSNKQLYGGRQSLFGVLQGQVLTTNNPISKPRTVYNIETEPKKTNVSSLKGVQEFPSLFLSDVSNRQIYGGRQSLFGVFQGQVLPTNNPLLKSVTGYNATQQKSSNNSKIANVLRSNPSLKIPNMAYQQYLKDNMTINLESTTTNKLQSSILHFKYNSTVNNIEFADNNLQLNTFSSDESLKDQTQTVLGNKDLKISKFLVSQWTEATESTQATAETKFVLNLTTEFTHLDKNITTDVTQNINGSSLMTASKPIIYSQTSTAVEPNATTFPATRTTDFETSVSSDDTSITVTRHNNTIIPTKCPPDNPCTQNPGLVAGVIVSLMCLIVIMFTGAFFCIKRYWKDNPESQPLLT